jgi:hypothetical protein
MNQAAQIEIELSKTKLTLMIFCSAIFVALGIWMVFFASSTFHDSIFNSPTLIRISGISSILFFGTCFIILLKKIGDKKPGLIINNTGIFDNSSGVSAGYISWNDVEEIKLVKIFDQKFLMIMVNNPEEYIQRQTSLGKRKTMSLNLKMYGSPIGISANGLKCNFNELENIVNKKFTEFKTKEFSF